MNTNIPLIAACAVLLTACYKETDYDPLATPPEEVINILVPSRSELLANGLDTVTITAVMPEDAGTGSDVVFTTSDGTFMNNGTNTVAVKSKLAIYNGAGAVIAQAYLRAPLNAGSISVRANVLGVERTLDLPSVRCYPISLQLMPQSLTLPGDDPEAESEITARLMAASGTVTKGHTVNVTAWNEAYSTTLGSFRVNDPSDINGACKLVFSLLPDVPYTGILHIIAATSGANNTISDTLTLYTTN